MRNAQIIERVLARLLREGDGGGDLGAYVRDLGDSKQAVLYDARALEEYLATYSGRGQLDREAIGETIVGYIIVAAPQNPCGGAWEVKAAWGPGRGREVYAVGHALSPTGILMPDRGGVSGSARRGWGKQGEEPRGRKWTPLDDVTHPPGHPHHTEDPSDDCTVHGIEALDRAYQPQGGEDAHLARLVRRHAEISAALPPRLPPRLGVVLRSEGTRRFAGGVG